MYDLEKISSYFLIKAIIFMQYHFIHETEDRKY